MSGKLIVIEGGDGSGKSTQAPLLANRLKKAGIDVCEVSFPRYDLPSGELIKMYLDGRMGGADDVGAYGASALYAADRFASYKLPGGWGEAYNAGRTVLSTRYTTSNMVHQTAKLERSKWAEYIDWLCDFEYKRIGLPVPDAVIYLDMPPTAAARLLSARYGGHEEKKDIHERDLGYVEICREAALFAAGRCSWKIVNCAEGDKPLSIEKISELIDRALFDTGINISGGKSE